MSTPHDIGVLKAGTYKTVVGVGFLTNISATVENQGIYSETFFVTIYANITCIAGRNVTLANEASEIVAFSWNTTGFSTGNYTISAFVSPVPEETDTADNCFASGWIDVALVGDFTGPKGIPDGKCDMRDIGTVARFFGQNVPAAPSNCDITGPTQGIPDGKIDMRDIGLVARHFGDRYTYP